MADYQVTVTDVNPIGNEIKTSVQHQYVSEGATLDETNADWVVVDGKKTASPGLALARVAATKKWVPYKDAAAAVAAFLDTGVVANNNAITFTAKNAGTGGNAIKVQLKDPAGNNQALAVSISGDTIVVSLATDGVGAITSTAADVIAAVNAHLLANQLVSAANTGASTGAAVVAAVNATALAGGTAAGANVYDDYAILDEKVIFDGADQIAGQLLVKGSVWEGACSGLTEAFKARVPGIRFDS